MGLRPKFIPTNKVYSWENFLIGAKLDGVMGGKTVVSIKAHRSLCISYIKMRITLYQVSHVAHKILDDMSHEPKTRDRTVGIRNIIIAKVGANKLLNLKNTDLEDRTVGNLKVLNDALQITPMATPSNPTVKVLRRLDHLKWERPENLGLDNPADPSGGVFILDPMKPTKWHVLASLCCQNKVDVKESQNQFSTVRGEKFCEGRKEGVSKHEGGATGKACVREK
ncbi:hypothetical protein LguiB_035422 [Lonicera macranthoides]